MRLRKPELMATARVGRARQAKVIVVGNKAMNRRRVSQVENKGGSHRRRKARARKKDYGLKEKEIRKEKIVGFEHRDFEMGGRKTWCQWPSTWLSMGGKRFRKYRRCTKPDVNAAWKVTTGWSAKKIMWFELKRLYAENGGRLQGSEEAPWKENY